MRAMWGALAAAATAVASAGPGCGGSRESSSALPDAQAMCPATPEQTVGAACAVAGLRCGPAYTCGLLDVTLLCICTGGAFRCTDGRGTPIDTAGAITCPGAASAGSCPVTERSAQLAPCSEQGLLCAYRSSCPNKFDPCQCSPGATASGGFGLRFECQPAVCGGVDGGTATFDSGRDSSSSFDSGVDGDSGAGADSGLEGSTGTDADSGEASDSASDGSSGSDAAGDAPSE
jgi:hypothetical protein